MLPTVQRFKYRVCNVKNLFLNKSPDLPDTQPASSSESEDNEAAAGSDAQDDEEAVVPRKAESGSEDSESGSDDQGRGAVKRKAPAAKVGELEHLPPPVVYCSIWSFPKNNMVFPIVDTKMHFLSNLRLEQISCWNLNIVARCLRMIYITSSGTRHVRHIVGFFFHSGRRRREGEHHPASEMKRRVALPRTQSLPPALNQTLAKTVTRYLARL